MSSETLGEKLGISEVLIKRSCTLSLEHQVSNELFHVDKRSSDAVFIVFSGSWKAKEWFSGKGAFGETKINSEGWSKEAFPSMRSIGNHEENRNKEEVPLVANVNQAFLETFGLVLQDSKFKDEVKSAVAEEKLVIFTGHSSGGAIAMLATIWFLEHNSKAGTAKCVTFGSPLVGDYLVSHALKREKWSKHFIHFVMRYDIVPRILLSPLSTIQEGLDHVLPHYCTANGHHFPRGPIASGFYTTVMGRTSALASHAACKLMVSTNELLETVANFTKLSPYRPFGTYIFCTGNKGKLVYMDNSEAVLQLLFHSSMLSHESELEETAGRCIDAHMDYETELTGMSLEENVYDVNQLEQLYLASDGTALDDLGLSTKGRLCLRAAGESEKRKKDNQDRILIRKKQEMDEGMKGLEDYKTFNAQRGGYYDAFKKQNEKRDFDANVNRLVLAGIWDEVIEMLKVYELPDELEGEDSWIELGTKLRRLVEPLDIANYYRHARDENSGTYMAKGRPKRYKYPQRWLEKKQGLEKDSRGESCFWAEVEELLKRARNCAKLDEVSEARAKTLQESLAKWIEEELVDDDVLLGESTFLKLWDELGRLQIQQPCMITKFANLPLA